MSTKNKKIDAPQVIEHDIEDEAAEEARAAELKKDELEKDADTSVDTVEIEVTLANGQPLTLEVIKDQNDWSYSAVEAMAEMNYAVLVNAILTPTSKLKLKMAGARVRDFEVITDKVSSAIGVIKAELDAEKKK